MVATASSTTNKSDPIVLANEKSPSLHKTSNRFQLCTNFYLTTIQFVKCLSVIHFMGYIIHAALNFVVRIKNSIKKKDPQHLNDKEIETKNVFHSLFSMPLSREITCIDNKHCRIALLNIMYTCMNQLLYSYEEERFEDLKKHCKEKTDSITRRNDISEIHKATDEIVRIISKEEHALPNLSIIFKHVFNHPPSDILKIIADMCNELATEEMCDELATRSEFKIDAKKAREYTQLLKSEPHPQKRHTIRNSMIISTANQIKTP